jgi:hypothetical protein
MPIADQRKEEEEDPNAPGSSKRKHFERASQKRGKRDFVWAPPQQPTVRPSVEPPRPPGWNPLVITPQAIRSEEEVRKIASQRLKESGKDQEDYMKREHELMEGKRQKARQEAEKGTTKKEEEDAEEEEEGMSPEEVAKMRKEDEELTRRLQAEIAQSRKLQIAKQEERNQKLTREAEKGLWTMAPRREEEDSPEIEIGEGEDVGNCWWFIRYKNSAREWKSTEMIIGMATKNTAGAEVKKWMAWRIVGEK